MKLDKFSVASFAILIFLFKANFVVTSASDSSVNVQKRAGNIVNVEFPRPIGFDPSEQSQNIMLGRPSNFRSNKERQEIPKPIKSDKIANNNFFMRIALVFFILIMIVPPALFIYFKHDEVDVDSF